jgi:putative NIF3 family GTP cyclohydrolase 1 type 2
MDPISNADPSVTAPDEPASIPGSLADLVDSIDGIVGAQGVREARAARGTDIVQHVPGPMARLGLALEPWPGLRHWAERERLDALFLHRRWGVEPMLPALRMAVVASHEGFDRRFGFGSNPELQAALGLRLTGRLAERDGYPLGTVAEGTPRTMAALRAELVAIFGGLAGEVAGDADRPAERLAERIAIARAMTAELVREAAALGADAYVTGQLRRPAMAAAADAGMHVFAVGHRRSERWALGVLAATLDRCWPGLGLCLAPDEP